MISSWVSASSVFSSFTGLIKSAALISLSSAPLTDLSIHPKMGLLWGGLESETNSDAETAWDLKHVRGGGRADGMWLYISEMHVACCQFLVLFIIKTDFNAGPNAAIEACTVC